MRFTGSPKKKINPYFPSNLNKISSELYIDTSKLLKEATLFSLWSFFTNDTSAKLKQLMLSANSAAALRFTQLSSFKGKNFNSFHVCHLCVEKDTKEHGICYLHTEHHLPGVNVCPVHNRLLSQTRYWHPDFHKNFKLPKLSSSPPSSLISLSRLSFDLFTYLNQTEKQPLAFHKLYKTALKERGFITQKNRVKRKEVLFELYRFCEPYIEYFPELLPASSQDFRYIQFLLSGEYNQHPVKHLIFTLWLFNSFDNYFRYISSPQIQKNAIKGKQRNKEDECLELLSAGKSINQTASLINKSWTFVNRISILNGLKPAIEHTKLLPVEYKRLLNLAYKGFHICYISKAFKISEGTVEQYISSTPGLVEHRKKCRKESKRRKYRVSILRFMQQNKNSTIKLLKDLRNKEYYWLYLNDKDWLLSTQPKKQQKHVPTRVDWQKRDLETSKRASVILEKQVAPMSRSRLDYLLGDHGWLIKYKSKMILTLSVFTYYQARFFDDQEL